MKYMKIAKPTKPKNNNGTASKRGRRKGSSSSSPNRMYFAEEQEAAVRLCIEAKSEHEKAKIFNQFLYKPFCTMIECIIKKYAYKFHFGSVSMEDLQVLCLSHLYENFTKFNPNKGQKVKDENGHSVKGADGKVLYVPMPAEKSMKAFSYCQAIVVNFFRGHSIEEKKKEKKFVHLQYSSDDLDDGNTEHLAKDKNAKSTINSEKEFKTLSEGEKTQIDYDKFFAILIEILKHEYENDDNLTRGEIKFYEALIKILEHREDIYQEEKFDKKQFLYRMRDMTGLNTKDVGANMKKIIDKYQAFKTVFLRDVYENK